MPEDLVTDPYLPLLIVVGLAVAFATVGMSVSKVISHLTMRGRRRSANKDTPCECGMPVLSDARTRFSVKFYIVAMLFILFDIEVVFLYPWAVLYGRSAGARTAADGGVLGLGLLFAELLVFALILFVGWIYVVRKGVLEWQTEA